MAEFLKLDLADTDEPIITTIEASDLDSLLKSEMTTYQHDDRFEPCFDEDRTRCFRTDDRCIKFSPGNGGRYTIAVYGPDDDETRELFAEYTD